MEILTQNYKNKIKEASNKISNIVGSTLGPGGRTVLVSSKDRTFLSKDGVTVARCLKSSDELESAIFKLIKESAERTNKTCGDGPQPLYSKVLTPNGFVEMGSLKIGDKICGTNNTIQQVVEIHPKGLKRIYKMHFSNARTVECCLDHLWNVTTHYGSKKTLTTKQLIDSKLKIEKNNGYSQYKYYTPISSVEFNNKHLELDPFLVGLLIGDGSLCRGGSIELSLSAYQEYILDRLVLPQNIKYTSFKDLKKNYIRVKFSRKEKKGPTMHDYIDRIGLLNKKAEDKYIPKQYLYSSYKNRMSLLDGLTESDGYINDRGLIEYSTISKQLCNDVVELFRGLGKQVYFGQKNKSGGYSSETRSFVVSELKGDQYGIKLKEIEETDEYTEMMCIKVSNPDHLYITNDYITTHNTTSTTILCDSFITKIFDVFNNKNYHYDKVYKDIDKCLDFVYKDLESQTKNIESEEDIEKVAYLSSNGDKEISSLVKRTLSQIGVDGSLSIKESKTPESSIEITDGYTMNSGFASQNFVNTNEYKYIGSDCIVFMYQGKMVQNKEIEVLFQKLSSDGRNVVLVAEEFDQQLLAIILYNNAKNSTKFLAVEAPYIGIKKSEAIKDLSMVVGGMPLHPIHNPISNFNPTHLGFSKMVTSSKNKTLFIGNNGDTTGLENYIEFLKESLKEANDEHEEVYYAFRINQLSSSTVTIYLGANTPAELQEKKHRLEDALEAATVALRGGVIPGCCAAIIRSLEKMTSVQDKLDLNYKIIPSIVEEILIEPFYVLVNNMNYSPSDIKNQILRSDSIMTYDLRTNKMVDAYKEGCIEPLFSNIQSIKNSYSLAKVLTSSSGALLGE